jgi:WD40 repeat protein
MNSSFDSDEGFSDLPYPGLRPFVREEADIFFGRNEQVYSLLNKLEKTRFLAVVGSSGCGKSSLIRAGLVPALEAGIMASAGSTWSIATMKPGSLPIQNLASALLESTLVGEEWRRYPDATAAVSSILRRGSRGIIELLRELRTSADHRYLIVVDQFEEIFRFHKYGNANEAIAFVDLLLEAARQTERPVFVTLSMRSDFLGDCSLFNGLPEAINNGQFLVPRLTREQCREAVIGPAVAFGGLVEDTLVARMLNDMQGDSDQLPLMQHALLQMWEMALAGQDRGDADLRLKLEHYEKIGGMDGSLSNHLEQVLQELAPEDVPVARKIFCRLTERSSSLRDTRRPAPLKELAEAAGVSVTEAGEVIRPFRLSGRSFLVPGLSVPLNADSIIDISHEALIRKWSRLSDWVDDESSAARIYQRLVETAELWEKNKAALWGTPDLENAIAWRETFAPNAAWASRYGGNFALAMRFLDESQRAAEEQERLTLERQQRELELSQEVARAEKQRADEAEQSRARQAQANRRLRSLLLVAGTVSILAITALAWAIWSKLENTALKESQEKIAQANELLIFEKSEVEKARRQVEISYRELAESREELIESNKLANAARMQEEEAKVQALLSKQAEERAQEEAKRLRITQGKANFQLANIRWNQGRVREAVELLESVPQEARSYEWGLCNRLFQGSDLKLQLEGDYRLGDVYFSADGNTVFHVSTLGEVECFNSRTGKKLRTFYLNESYANVAFSPNGRWLVYSSSRTSALIVLDLETEERVAVMDCQGYSPRDLEFSPDGSLLKVHANIVNDSNTEDRSNEYVMQIWSTVDWKMSRIFREQSGNFSKFSSAGLIINQTSASIEIVQASTGKVLSQFQEFAYLKFIPGSNELIKLGDGESGRAYQLIDGLTGSVKRELTLQGSNTPESYEFELSPDGYQLLTKHVDNSLRSWSITTGSPLRVFSGHTERISDYTFSPCGTKVASCSEDGTLRIWGTTLSQPLLHKDAKALGKLTQIVQLGDRLISYWIKANPENERLQQLSRWDESSNELVDQWDIRGLSATVATVSENGRMLALYSPVNKSVGVLDIEARKQIAEFPWPDEDVAAISISKDGLLLCAAGGTRLEENDMGNDTPKNINKLAITWDLTNREEKNRYERKVVQEVWRASTILAADISSTNRYVVLLTPLELIVIDLQADGSVQTIARQRNSWSSRELGFVEVARNEERVIIGGGGEFAEVIDLENGKKVFDLVGDIHQLRSVCFSPDGERIAAGDFSGRLKIFEATTGNELFQMNADSQPIETLQWATPETIISQGNSYEAIYYTADFRPKNQPVEAAKVRPVKTISNSDLEMFVGFDGFIHVVKSKLGQEVHRFALDTDQEPIVKVSPTGKYLIGTTAVGQIFVWNPVSGILVHELQGHSGKIGSIDFAANEERMISSGEDHTLRLWDLASGNQLQVLSDKWGKDEKFSLDSTGQRIATYGTGAEIRVFDLATGRLNRSFEWNNSDGSVYFADEMPNLIAYDQEQTKIWSLESGDLLLDSKLGAREKDFAFSTNGRYLLKRSSPTELIVEDAQTGEVSVSIPSTDTLSYARFSPQTKYLCLNYGRYAQVWSVAEGTKLVERKDGLPFIFSENDQYMVVVDSKKMSLLVWDLTKEAYVELQGNVRGATAVEFSKDLQRLYSFGDSGFSIWNLSTSTLERTVETDLGVQDVIPLDNEGLIFCALGRRTVALFSSTTGELEGVKQFEGYYGKYASRAGGILTAQKQLRISTNDFEWDRHDWLVSFDKFSRLSESELKKVLRQDGGPRTSSWVVQVDENSCIRFDGRGVSEDGKWQLAVKEDWRPTGPIRQYDLSENKIITEDEELHSLEMLENAKNQWHRKQAFLLEELGNNWAAMLHLAWLLKSDPQVASTYDKLHRVYDEWIGQNPLRSSTETNESSTSGTSDVQVDTRLPIIVREMLLVARGNKVSGDDYFAAEETASVLDLTINDRLWKKVARPLAAEDSVSPEELEEMRQLVEKVPQSAYVNTLAVAEYRAGNLDEAIEAFRRSISLNTEGKDDQYSYSCDYAILVLIYLKQGNQQEADRNYALFEKAFANEKAGNSLNRLTANEYSIAVETKTAYLGEDHRETLIARRDFGMHLSMESELETAKVILEEVIARLEKSLGREHLDTQLALAYLGYCLNKLMKYDEAPPLLEEAYRTGKENKELDWIESNIRYAYVQGVKLAEYDRWMTEVRLPDVRKTLAEDPAALAEALREYGNDYHSLNSNEKAVKLLVEALEVAKKSDNSSVTEAKIGSLLGEVYLAEKKYQEAEDALELAHTRLLEQELVNPLTESQLMLENLDRLIKLCVAQMDTDGESDYQKFKVLYQSKLSPN